jgi:predicted XRE-type DNA-binding protein
LAVLTEAQKAKALARLRALLKKETQKVVADLLGYTQPYISLVANEKMAISKNLHALLMQ